MSTITITAFQWAPEFARGLVRDLRVRWALEEAGLEYRERLLGMGDQKSSEHRKRQPFEQIPTYEENGLVLFESGAIVLHIANQSEALMPADPGGRARVTAWIFAALNSIEPAIANLAEIDLFHSERDWASQRRPDLVERVSGRLGQLSRWLDRREYLEGDRFTAADLMMTTVLRIPRNTDLVEQHSNLAEYRERCQTRPAFRQALANHLAPFDKAETA